MCYTLSYDSDSRTVWRLILHVCVDLLVQGAVTVIKIPNIREAFK